ncbi:UNVERIFIED_CONTAM: hypothetical protein FKN15_004413 [Acipenser sinensis]
MSAIKALNPKAEVARAQAALAVNISAARGLQDVLKSNLGPKGTMKMLVSGAGDIKLTKDGNVLLHEMQIQHPTASLIAKVATAQDDITGDGTTSNVLIIGELLKQADLYVSEGLHPRIIAEGFEAAKEKALQVLEQVKVTKEMDRETLINVARTSLRTKVHVELADLLTEFVRAQKYKTEAEAFGWSFVFQDFVSDELKSKVTQRIESAPWWLPIEKVFWRQGKFPDEDSAEDGYHGVSPVKAFPPQNNYGLCDMLGNTWEWTDSEYLSKAPPPGRHTPHKMFVLRGASWIDSVDGSANHRARVTTRMGNTPDSASDNLGFRCVASVEPKDQKTQRKAELPSVSGKGRGFLARKSGNLLPEVGWKGKFPDEDSAEDGYHGVSPVKAFPPQNNYGLCDMLGNTWEWTDSEYLSKAPPPGRHTPHKMFVLRGASWIDSVDGSANHRARVTTRMGNTPDSASDNLGFRCVASVEPKDQKTQRKAEL